MLSPGVAEGNEKHVLSCASARPVLRENNLFGRKNSYSFILFFFPFIEVQLIDSTLQAEGVQHNDLAYIHQEAVSIINFVSIHLGNLVRSFDLSQISKKRNRWRSSHYGSVVMNPTCIHEDAGSILDLAQWVKDLALLWLWRTSDLAPNLGTFICHRCGPKKKKKK